MTIEEWVIRLRSEGFSDGHIQLLKGTNKTVTIETGWFYSPFGLESKIKPYMGTVTLTNLYINGKNHWVYNSNTYFTGEKLDDFKISDYSVFDTANHPEYQEYRKKFNPEENIDYVKLEKVDKNYLRTGNFAAQREGSSFVLFTFNLNTNDVDQHIHIGADRVHLFKKWFNDVMLKE